ncbi:MAG TPA: hypothetical protein V6D47_01435 [Oscillatoriaceae cyanobacterium]
MNRFRLWPRPLSGTHAGRSHWRAFSEAKPSARGKLARWSLTASALALTAIATTRPALANAMDPNVRMYTLETPHFSINFPEGYEDVAQEAAAFAELANSEVSPWLGTEPTNKTQLSLFDNTDSIDGLALPYVNNEEFVWLTNPDDEEMWGRYDNWLKLVITHEYTHVLDFETTAGLSKALNSVFGRFLFPNLFQPTSLIEGLAVTSESMFTNDGRGGRGNEGYYDMYLRADVLAHRQLSLDQAGGYWLTDFPGGDSPYVYGVFFWKYLVMHYGAKSLPEVQHAYAAAPYLGVDHAFKQVTGRDFEEIWDEFLAWLRARAQTEVAQIEQHPLTPLHRVTFTGQSHFHPEYMPNGHLSFIEGLRHNLDAVVEVTGTQPNGHPIIKRLFPKTHYGTYDVSADGKSIYYFTSDGPNNYVSYNDIVRYDLATGARDQLTQYLRVDDPAVSPDGQEFIAVKNGRGDNNLWLFDDSGHVIKRLTDLHDNTQFSTPRWSPDGKHVVLSSWHGGCRDLYMIDTDTWRVYPLWKDYSVDMAPCWSPDGKYVVFASDRDHRNWNIFAYDWQAKKLYEVTNVLTGAFEPTVSPDGKNVAMVVSVGKGTDIYTAPWNPASWRAWPTPGFDDSIHAYHWVQKVKYPVHAYNPIPSMMPKFWSPLYISANNVLGAFTIGYDTLLTNTLFAMGGYTLTQPTNTPPGTSINPIDLAMTQLLYQNSFYDTNWGISGGTFPSSYPIPLANGSTLNLYQHYTNGSFTLSWNNLPSPLTNSSYQDGSTLTLGYNVLDIADMTPADYNKQAEDAKLMPAPGRSNSISLTYKYNTNGKYGFSVSPEYGDMGTFGAEVAHPWLGSETTYTKFFGDWRTWHKTPWPQQIFATRLMGGVNFGKPQGDFYLGGTRSPYAGGTPDIRMAADPGDLLEPLRGYPLASTSGNTIGLFSAEYRFPIYNIQRGIGSLPFFGQDIYGAFFTDDGFAFTNSWVSLLGQTPDPKSEMYPGLPDFRSSVGFELRLNFSIANNPLNSVPISTIVREVAPSMAAFNDSSGIFRLGVAQALLPAGGSLPGPTVYTEFGTIF